MKEENPSSQTTKRRIADARRLLQAAGFTIIPPAPVKVSRMLDQCEYPDLHEEPGDTCANSTDQLRKTRYGTLWLCCDHFDAPLKEIFDERLNHVQA